MNRLKGVIYIYHIGNARDTCYLTNVYCKVKSVIRECNTFKLLYLSEDWKYRFVKCNVSLSYMHFR